LAECALSVSTSPHCRHSTWTAEILLADDSGRPLTETCYYRTRPVAVIRENRNRIFITRNEKPRTTVQIVQRESRLDASCADGAKLGAMIIPLYRDKQSRADTKELAHEFAEPSSAVFYWSGNSMPCCGWALRQLCN
jgi:hypothetical protein